MCGVAPVAQAPRGPGGSRYGKIHPDAAISTGPAVGLHALIETNWTGGHTGFSLPCRAAKAIVPAHFPDTFRVRFRLPSPHSSAWVIAETGTGALFSLFSMLLIGRVIGPEAAGTATVATAAFLLLDLACGSLFNDAVVQRRDLRPEHARSAVTVQVLVGVAGGLMLAALSPRLAAGAEAPRIAWLCLALAPLLPLSAFSGAASGLILRHQRYRLLAMRALLGMPAALLAGLLAAHHGAGPWAMVAYQAAATTITFLLLLSCGGLDLRPLVSRRALAELWPVAGPQILSVVVQAGRYRLFVLVLGFLTAEAVVAVCNAAFRLLDAALSVVWGSVTRLAMPRLSALQGDNARIADAYGEIAQLQALMGMPVAAGVALTAPDLVQALLGPAWAAASDAAQVVGLVAIASFCWGDAGSLFVALGKTRRNLMISTVSLVAPLAALLIARPQTPQGVALCWACSTLAIAPWVGGLVLAELRRGPLWLARQLAPALGATALMASAVLVLQAALAGAAPILRLMACAALGAAVYGMAAWLALGRQMPHALSRAQVVPAE